jgi:UDPglucose--hexose-1-phosphate uridylyltransferase
MHRTTTRLSDGRELIYYDAAPGAARDFPDRRGLAPAIGGSQLRYDALTDEWIAIAGHRQTRISGGERVSQCPLCPSDATRLTEIPAPDYEVAVFENRFPALAGRTEAVGPHPDPAPRGGRCEVVCFSDQHEGSFGTLGPTRARLVLAALSDRYRDLSARADVRYVAAFENRGALIGQTLVHPHGQIYAFPFIPPRPATTLLLAAEHHARTGRQLHADLLAAEQADGTRIITAGEHWTCYVPTAARWPVEAHLVPHRDVADLTELTEPELVEGAVLLLDLLARVDALYDNPLPYVAAWHQAPVRHPDRRLVRLHLQLTSPQRAADKLKYLAGAESAMGAFIGDRLPEETAAMLRDAQ